MDLAIGLYNYQTLFIEFVILIIFIILCFLVFVNTNLFKRLFLNKKQENKK